MSFRSGATAAAFCVFALVIIVAAQAPTQAQAQDSDLYSLRQQAAGLENQNVPHAVTSGRFG